MFKEKSRNWDRKTLAGDHSVPRALGGRLCDRLLHSTCNGQRGDGRLDRQRPVLTSTHPRDWRAKDAAAEQLSTDNLAMDW
ncbi:hypothetical protein ACORG1_13495 [Mycobacterium sp. TJFP1]|jgi:hypothetical protein